jgi:hypothetical protein
VAPGRQSFELLFATIGAAYVVGGLLDHLEMTRILRPAAEGGDDGAI